MLGWLTGAYNNYNSSYNNNYTHERLSIRGFMLQLPFNPRRASRAPQPTRESSRDGVRARARAVIFMRAGEFGSRAGLARSTGHRPFPSPPPQAGEGKINKWGDAATGVSSLCVLSGAVQGCTNVARAQVLHRDVLMSRARRKRAERHARKRFGNRNYNLLHRLNRAKARLTYPRDARSPFAFARNFAAINVLCGT
jgi:hypothetical protein